MSNVFDADDMETPLAAEGVKVYDTYDVDNMAVAEEEEVRQSSLIDWDEAVLQLAAFHCAL